MQSQGTLFSTSPN